MANFKDVITSVTVKPIASLLFTTITKVTVLPYVKGPDEESPYQLLTQTLTLAAQMIADKSVTLSFTPAHPEDTVLTPYGCIPQVYGLDYTIQGNVLTWAGLGAEELMFEGEPFTLQYSDTDMHTDTVTLDASMIAAKQVTLTAIPTQSAFTVVIPYGGITQVCGADFTVTGSQLNWSGLGLDGMIQAGDTLRVQYFT